MKVWHWVDIWHKYFAAAESGVWVIIAPYGLQNIVCTIVPKGLHRIVAPSLEVACFFLHLSFCPDV
jgi:hypothetical protein